MTTLVLCRHADPTWPQQAEVLAHALREFRPDAVYTSPLPRAAETAMAVARAHGLEPIEVDELREIDLGSVEGRAFDDFPPELQRSLLEEPTRARFPDGENYAELRRRVCEALGRVVDAHPEATLVVVTHAGPIRAALATWLHIADEGVFRIAQRYAAVNVIEWLDGVPTVQLVNGRKP